MNFTLGVVWFKHYKKGSCYVCESLLRWHAQCYKSWGNFASCCTSCTKIYLFFFTCENFDICTILENSGQLCNISSSLSPHGGRAITLAHKLKQPNQQPSGLFLIQAWTTINFTLTFENLVKSDSTLFASPTLWCSTLCVG